MLKRQTVRQQSSIKQFNSQSRVNAFAPLRLYAFAPLRLCAFAPAHFARWREKMTTKFLKSCFVYLSMAVVLKHFKRTNLLLLLLLTPSVTIHHLHLFFCFECLARWLRRRKKSCEGPARSKTILG